MDQPEQQQPTTQEHEDGDAGASASGGGESGGGDAPPLSPPDGAIKVTPDGGVLKVVLAEGSGEPPVLHARCLVHYVGRLVPSGEVFLNTRDDSQAAEPQLVIAGRDASSREAGLNLAVATMRPGERAAVYVTDAAYGYGPKGSFSFPAVPPSSQLVYDVRMLTWEPPEETADRRSMLFEERLEAAERRRLEGNALFAQGRHVEALGKYAMALSFCDEDFMLQLHGPHLDKAEAVTSPVLLNMAAAHLKVGDFAAAAHSATQVLVRDTRCVKALFRRARARAGMGRTGEALEDLREAARIDPGDREIQRELAALTRVQRDEQAATAKLFKGALGPRPAPRPGAAAPAAATGASGSGSDNGDAAADGAGAAAGAVAGAAAGGAAGSSGKAAAATAARERQREAGRAPAAGGDAAGGGGGGVVQRVMAALAAFVAFVLQLLGVSSAAAPRRAAR